MMIEDKIELLHIILRLWIKEKNTNKYKLAYLADRAIMVIKDEIRYIKENYE